MPSSLECGMHGADRDFTSKSELQQINRMLLQLVRCKTEACLPAWAQIHWFSIINSCVTVLLLTGFLATILMRVLKNDFLKYSRDDDGALPRPSHSHARTSRAVMGLLMHAWCDQVGSAGELYGAI